MNTDGKVRIGGGAAFLMDSVDAVPQLLEAGVDYIMLDSLAEGALSVLSRMARQDPASGFSSDFITTQVGVHLAAILAKGTKIVANAGGVNPDGCAKALRDLAAREGLSPRIAVVHGDNLADRVEAFRAEGLRDMFDGKPFPEGDVLCTNVYLGAFPIAKALQAGADIVITGRVADSAMALGPLIAEFGWKESDHDLLAAGTLAGHLLECGCHATGGTFTDWRDVVDGWADMGYPIAECGADGRFVMTKPENTGGLVSVATVAEQMLYEISDPQTYTVADVVCDFSGVTMEQVGLDRVLVSGARGYPPTGFYKLSVACHAGWRGFLVGSVVGFDADEKARRQGRAIIERVSRMLRARNMPPFFAMRVEAIGAGDSIGRPLGEAPCREVVLRVTADHLDLAGAGLFAREQNMAVTSMSVGYAGALAAGTQPLADISSYLVPRGEVAIHVELDGVPICELRHGPGAFDPALVVRPEWPEPVTALAGGAKVPLIDLVWARSGDKGGTCNIGLIPRRPELAAHIAAVVTIDAVRDWLGHCFEDGRPPQVERYYLPGLPAFNFVLSHALGGSATISSRLDPYGKTMAQQLLAMQVPVPVEG